MQPTLDPTLPSAAKMILEYGEQAYHKAIEFVVIATHCEDRQGAAHFAAVAHELMRKGFHKHAKKAEGA